MKVELEIVADRKGCTITINGTVLKSQKGSGGLFADIESLWSEILEAKVFDTEDDERGVYNEDSEYPCSILDVVITERNLDSDGYSAGLDGR